MKSLLQTEVSHLLVSCDLAGIFILALYGSHPLPTLIILISGLFILIDVSFKQHTWISITNELMDHKYPLILTVKVACHGL